jgi:predicted PurR-regulated permease PerM
LENVYDPQEKFMAEDRIVTKYIYAFFILLLGIFLFLGLREFFSSFLGSIIFYTLFKNFMSFLTKKKKFKKPLGAVIIIVISFFIVVLPVGFLFTVIFNKVSALAQDPEFLTQFTLKITHRLNSLPFKISTANMAEKAQLLITQNLGRVLNSSLTILGSILMMYFFLYFLLVNTNKMEASIVHYLPFRRSKIMLLGRELVEQTKSNAVGVPLVCIAQGLAAYLSYRIANVPEAGLWGILTGFSSVIPLVGTAIIWVPVTLFLLADGHQWQGIFVAAYSIVIMSNVDNLIRMVVSKKIGDVHPVITVLGVIVGLKFFGLPGLVFGPLIISYFIILLKLYYQEYSRPKQKAEEPVKIETNIIKLVLNKLSFFSAPLNKITK